MDTNFDKKEFKAQIKKELEESIKSGDLKDQIKKIFNKDEIKSQIKETLDPKLIKESVKGLIEKNKLATFKVARILNLIGFVISLIFYIYFTIKPSGNFQIHSLLSFAVFFICFKHTDVLVKVYSLFENPNN